jgi:hypothetical protein
MRRAIELADGVQFLLYVCIALVLVAIGPLVWCFRLLTTGRVGWLAAVAALWLPSLLVVARQLRRRLITELSLGIFLVWLVVLVWVFNDWFV